METGRKNPFTLDFGREPYEMIPRSVLMTELVQTFTDEFPSRHNHNHHGRAGKRKNSFYDVCLQAFSEGKKTGSLSN